MRDPLKRSTKLFRCLLPRSMQLREKFPVLKLCGGCGGRFLESAPRRTHRTRRTPSVKCGEYCHHAGEMQLKQQQLYGIIAAARRGERRIMHRLSHPREFHHTPQPCRAFAEAHIAERDIFNSHLQIADGAVFNGSGVHRAVVKAPFMNNIAQRVADIEIFVYPLIVIRI